MNSISRESLHEIWRNIKLEILSSLCTEKKTKFESLFVRFSPI